MIKEFFIGIRAMLEISKHLEYLLSLNDEVLAAQKKEAEDIARILRLLSSVPCLSPGTH